MRKLVFQNMTFAGQKDSVSQETVIFNFLMECVNDLKMKLVSVRPITPTVNGLVTTNGYDIQLEGDFFSFGEFCSKLENSRRVLALTSFEVTQMSKVSGSLSRELASTTKNGNGAAAPVVSHNSVGIKLHLDTFRVRKGA